MPENVKKCLLIFVALAVWAGFNSCTGPDDLGEAVAQTAIPRIEQMPELPAPLKIINWKQKALQFDSLAFDFNSTVPYAPYIWLDSARRNIDQVTYGLYTVIGDIRQQPGKNNGEFHEALTSLNALLSAGLSGIDKTSQHGYNFVQMAQNYFNIDNGWNIMMNNTNPDAGMLGGGYGRDWWYDVYPNVLYYGVAALFPDVENTSHIQLSIAEQFYRADSVLNGNYDYSYFDYAQMKGMRNQIPWQQDAAGGHAYVLYLAYQKFGDERYLKAAKRATEVRVSQKESRFYEILEPFGAYTAARLNAETGTNYDVTRLLNHTFDGCMAKDGRYGWGVIADKWGDYDVSGMLGSITDGGGYGFFMNSVAMAWPLVPMVKYEPQYATAIGRYMLNAVNASRLFYPDQIDDRHQWLPAKKSITNGIIGYEGVRKRDDMNNPALAGVSPVAIGDGPKWTEGQPEESMFSLYSTSIVGVFGAIVNTTDVKGILMLNCNATDFYASDDYPVFLIYNPYGDARSISVNTGDPSDLFDIVSRTYLARNILNEGTIEIPAGKAVVMVQLPARTRLKTEGRKIKAGNSVIAYK